MPTKEKVLYLTFDDGPVEIATPFVLDELKKYNAKATFFCIGKNVVENKNLYERILSEGHAVGNHTNKHLNGWKTNDEEYIANYQEAKKLIDSNLFRPPYGRITRFQASIIRKQSNIIMWSVLSGDFDIELSPQNCLENVLLNAKPGNIIVFHDSMKAFDRLSFALPEVLKYFSEEGFEFKSLAELMKEKISLSIH
jgi:peptidoglycan/xylan/chitin deacetylase (PgdA/CDA1 family)